MKYTLITGASSGIGYAAAKAFAARGKNLILVARRLSKLEQLQAEIKQSFPDLEVVIYQADLSDSRLCEEMYDDCKKYSIETWVNNAGVGIYGAVGKHAVATVQSMLHINVEALTVLSTLYVRDYKDVEGTQLINVSSAGGYTLVQSAITYCASKFYVSAFTEGLSHELNRTHAKMKAKLLAPFLTETGFAKVANQNQDFSYKETYQKYHSSEEVANLLLKLYDSDMTVGLVSREDFSFSLSKPLFRHASPSK